MLAKITLENFFSFGEATEIELNPDINILVGINGSGKSNFLKAIRLLTESIVGEGFEKVFLKDWGGFNAVGNFNKEQKDYIKLTYEFDKDAVQKAVENQGFEKDASNQTKVSIKTEEDFENWNDNYLVGQLWLSGQIGGKRW